MIADDLPHTRVTRLPLTELRPNERAVVIEFAGGRMARSRLMALGFTPGAEVRMSQNYGRGPLIVSVRGGQVALGRGEARHISVERVPA
jgi:ferrous iron transport protein A